MYTACTRGESRASSTLPSTSTSPSFITVTASAEREDAVDVVLDQQHRQVGRDALDELTDALALGRGQPGQRLVEQQHAAGA